MKKPRFPRIKVNLEDYNIDIHAGSEFRDRVGFIYRIKGDKNNREKSLKKLRYIVKTLNIDCIKNEKSSEAYCRTEQMLKERYMIDNVHLINTKLNELIEKAK